MVRLSARGVRQVLLAARMARWVPAMSKAKTWDDCRLRRISPDTPQQFLSSYGSYEATDKAAVKDRSETRPIALTTISPFAIRSGNNLITMG